MKRMLILSVASFLVSATVLAGINQRGPAPVAKDDSVAVDAPAAAVPRGAAKAPKGRYLRCWQYGRLILDEPVTNTAPAQGGKGFSFESGSGREVQVLDLQHAACVVK